MELNPASENRAGVVFFAVTEEARPFRVQLRREGIFPEPQIIVSGMGAANAERAFRRLINSERQPGWILTCGFAGGLDPELTANTIVYDADPVHPICDRLAQKSGRLVRFHCASRIVVTADAKRALRAETGADAVEMESGIVRELARERQIPAATVRVILDTAEETLPLDFNALMTPQMTLDGWGLARKLLRSPSRIPALMRFGRRSQRAAETLAEALVELLV